MDIWVYNAQVWVNQTYQGVTGYVPAPETGVTGWSTMYALTRALQHELGITQLSENFGPATMSAFTTQLGTINSATVATKPNIVAILQCALWCKGYWGSSPFGAWDTDVASSILQVRSEMGIGGSTPTVTAKMMKSILTMDAYITVGSGTAKIRQTQQWLNSRYVSRLDFYILPADGIYSRQVQEGLMYAIQYEIGMADGVANGVFGPGTQQGIRDYGVFGLNATDGTRKMVSLYQAALIFNGYSTTPFSGNFNSVTQAQTSSFQTFVGLSNTGSANFSTWASLLVSTGDVARAATACDTSTPLTALTAQQLYTSGYRKVGRYINGTEKRLLHGEAAIIWSKALQWFPIYQENNDRADEFDYIQGQIQGQRIAMRMRQMGIKSGSRVYLAVDFDATAEDIEAVVIPHFQGVKLALDASKTVTYKLGVYGTRNVCATLAAQGLTESSFVSDMSTGYSGNLGFKLPTNWAYDQIQTLEVGSGNSAIEIDKVVASSNAQSLTSSAVDRTPRKYSGSDPVGFDETFFWRIAGLSYRAEAASSSIWITQTARNEILLTLLQKPTYWGPSGSGLLWASGYTPSYSESAPTPEIAAAIEAAAADLESAAIDLYPRPADGRFGDTRHFAASTRGYTKWGVPAAGNTSAAPGDLGGWALDLVQAWNDYEEARLAAPSGVLAARAWFAASVGQTSPGFGADDLRADMAAYLCAKRMVASPDKALDGIVREMLCAIEDDPGWLAKTFSSERFNGRAAMVAAAKDVFTSPWLPSFGRAAFIAYRGPGTASSTLNPSAAVLAAELDDVANGFADAVEAAKAWTTR